MDSQRMWNIETWKEILAEDQVIVMTADVLFNLLTHNFVSITNINLLIFDEAHHAKKNHVYARIIRDFYLHVPDEKRPKIFGLTASPVDARTNVVQAATELEKLLHSQIVTTSDLSLLQSAIRRPDEKVMKYEKLKAPEDTPLTAKMRQEYGTIKAIRKICTYSNEASAELGTI
jgi:endoribonuclease Dicer